MRQINIEIKARCPNPARIKKILKSKGADFKGTDHQIDIYFKVPKGYLKLRKGEIENALVYYQREKQKGPKKSNVLIFYTKSPILKKIVTSALKVLVVVDKKREIYFIKNVKFHIDKVSSLGSFVEIEAIDRNGSLGRKKLMGQCKFYMKELEIKEKDLIANSYSDMLV